MNGPSWGQSLSVSGEGTENDSTGVHNSPARQHGAGPSHCAQGRAETLSKMFNLPATEMPLRKAARAVGGSNGQGKWDTGSARAAATRATGPSGSKALCRGDSPAAATNAGARRGEGGGVPLLLSPTAGLSDPRRQGARQDGWVGHPVPRDRCPGPAVRAVPVRALATAAAPWWCGDGGWRGWWAVGMAGGGDGGRRGRWVAGTAGGGDGGRRGWRAAGMAPAGRPGVASLCAQGDQPTGSDGEGCGSEERVARRNGLKPGRPPSLCFQTCLGVFISGGHFQMHRLTCQRPTRPQFLTSVCLGGIRCGRPI